MGAMEVDLQHEQLLEERFERYYEVKSLEEGKKVIRFTLLTCTGKEYVAASGEDNGGSHYNYHADPEFKAVFPFKGQNRRDVVAWLEFMIRDSQARHPTGPQVLEGLQQQQQQQEQQQQPMQQQQQQQPMEQPGQQQHQQPLQQSQQQQPVEEQQFLPFNPAPGQQEAFKPSVSGVQGPGDTLPLTAQVPGGATHPAKSVVMSPSKGGHGAKGGGSKAAGMKHRLVGVAHEAHLKRLRRIAGEGQQVLRAAQAGYLARLRQVAAAEAAQREGAQNLTAGWVRGEPSEDESAVLSQWLGSLKDLFQLANKKQLQTVKYIEVQMPTKIGQLMGQAPHIGLREMPNDSQQQGPGKPNTHDGIDHVLVVTYGGGSKAVPADARSRGAVNGSKVKAQGDSQEGGKQGIGGTPSTSTAGVKSEECKAAADTAIGEGKVEGAQGDGHQVHGLPGKLLEAHTWSYTDPHLHMHGVRIILECLRELGAFMLPLKALLQEDIINTVKACAETHPHPAVSRFAKQVLGRWQRVVLQHVALLVSDQALRDPVAELETKITLNQIAYPEEIVAMQQMLQSQEAMLSTSSITQPPHLSPAVNVPFPSSLLNDLTSMGPEAALKLLTGKSTSAGPAPGFMGAGDVAPAALATSSTAAAEVGEGTPMEPLPTLGEASLGVPMLPTEPQQTPVLGFDAAAQFQAMQE